MENLVRIESIEINGIKNVCHGVIDFNEYANILKGNFHDWKSVIGIYGQNGSGKTTVLEVTQLLKKIILGDRLPDDFHQLISHQCDEAKISYTFFVQSNQGSQLITYTLCIGMIEESYEIYYEKITSKEYSESENKWKPQTTLIECQNKEILLKKLAKNLSKESLIELRVAQDIEKGTSFIFNKRNKKILLGLDKEENAKLVEIVKLLPMYVERNLIIIRNDVMGSINLNSLVPINLYISSHDSLTMGEIPINLLRSNALPQRVYQDLQSAIQQIDIVLNAVVPSLHLQIMNPVPQLLKNGEEGIHFDVVSVRDNQPIPLKYESEGIKRLISVISSMIAAYNNQSICLMIDEFDSGIFEYLLGELVEIIDESAKGQFVFTSHNLRALEKLSYKSIIITTVNPQNRYIQMTGVKPNNNVRDYYYKNIILGGQNESIYEETKNYQIKRALRNAGEK